MVGITIQTNVCFKVQHLNNYHLDDVLILIANIGDFLMMEIYSKQRARKFPAHLVLVEISALVLNNVYANIHVKLLDQEIILSILIERVNR